MLLENSKNTLITKYELKLKRNILKPAYSYKNGPVEDLNENSWNVT